MVSTVHVLEDNKNPPPETWDTDDWGNTVEGRFAISEPTNGSAKGHLERYSSMFHGKALLSSTHRDLCKGCEWHARHNFLYKWTTPPSLDSKTENVEHNSLGATHEVGEYGTRTHVHKDDTFGKDMTSHAVLPPNAIGLSARSGLVNTDPLKDSIHESSS